MRSAPFLQLDLRASRLQRGLLLLMLFLAAAAVLISGLPPVFQVALMALTLALWVAHIWQRRRHLLLRATLQRDGIWLLQGRDDSFTGTLCAASAVGSLMSLTWNTPRGLVHLLIWPDALSASSARELRVWLRGGRALLASAQAEPLDLI